MDSKLVAAHPPDSTALIQGDRMVTYGELNLLAGRTAAGLRAAGVGAGDRVVVIGPNDVAFVTGLLAAQAIGAVACPFGHQNPRAVVEARVANFSPSAMIVSPLSAEMGRWVIDSGLLDPATVGTPAGSPSDDLPMIADDEPIQPVEVDGPDVAFILHTSGIVGSPRAAVLSNSSLATAQERIIGAGPGLKASDISLGALPFTHVLGLNMCLLPSLRVGAAVVLQPAWQSEECLELVARHRVTQVVAVPAMWASWIAAARASGGPSSVMATVGFARSGASDLHPAVADGAYEMFGVELAQGYGLTETAGTVTFETEARLRPGSVGRPLPGVEIKLVEDGTEVEPGDRGEVWIRTGSVFDGYLGDAAATADVLISDGWLATGDVGIQDDDGTLYLIGRSKDLINVSGFNVFPAEVEEVLEAHLAVHEAVVIGEPQEMTGERVVAYITPAGGGGLEGGAAGEAAADVDDIINHCRQYLARYKVPSSVHLVERLPLTPMGKRVRKELR